MDPRACTSSLSALSTRHLWSVRCGAGGVRGAGSARAARRGAAAGSMPASCGRSSVGCGRWPRAARRSRPSATAACPARPSSGSPPRDDGRRAGTRSAHPPAAGRAQGQGPAAGPRRARAVAAGTQIPTSQDIHARTTEAGAWRHRVQVPTDSNLYASGYGPGALVERRPDFAPLSLRPTPGRARQGGTGGDAR